MNVSDESRPRYDPAAAAALACAAWDFDVWVYLGCPLRDARGNALQLHEETNVAELRAIFLSLSR